MGRPVKDSILFFSHDSDASSSWKFAALRAQYGHDKGWAMEGRFWALNGMIAASEGCRLDLGRPQIERDVARKLELSLEELRNFIHFLCDREQCDLLNAEAGKVWTDRCQEELEAVRKAREADRRRKRSGSEGIPSGKLSSPAGLRQENPVIHADSSRISGFSGELGELGKEGGTETGKPPLSAAPSEEAETATPKAQDSPVDLIGSLRAINSSLVMSDSDRAKLAELIALEPWETILEAYRAQQARIPGKAWHFFVQDFARWKNQARAAAKKSPGKPYVPPELHHPTPQDDAEVKRLAAEAREKLHLPPAEAPPPAPPEQSHLADDDVF